MALVRWEPFRELAALQNEMGRLLNVFEGNGQTTQSWVPALDVWESDDELVFAFDLPGIPEEQISVELNDDALTVSAERERAVDRKDDGFYRFERRHGTFTRTVGLPQGVTDADITAVSKDGVLEVHVRKPAQPKPRRIPIGSGRRVIEGKKASA